MSKSKVIIVKIESDTKSELKSMAESMNKTMTEMVKEEIRRIMLESNYKMFGNRTR